MCRLPYTVLIATLVLLHAGALRAQPSGGASEPAGTASPRPSAAEVRRGLRLQVDALDAQLRSERASYEQYGIVAPIVVTCIGATVTLVGLVGGFAYSSNDPYDDTDENEPRNPRRARRYLRAA